MAAAPPPHRLRLRLVFEGRGMIGPGKADILEVIARTGSIAAAGREMGMSYRRAWQLVETLNALFRAPVVESVRGGPGGGGASLTATGRTVLDAYRRMEVAAGRATAGEAGRIADLLGPGDPGSS